MISIPLALLSRSHRETLFGLCVGILFLPMQSFCTDSTLTQPKQPTTDCRSQDLQSDSPDTHRVGSGNPTGLDAGSILCMVPIPCDTFVMGSNNPWAELDERPPHPVSISAFWLSKYEITNAQLRYVMQWALDHDKICWTDSTVMNREGNQRPLLDLSRSGFGLDGDRFCLHDEIDSQPCLEITWFGAQAFCNYLSDMEGLERCIDFSAWTCDFSRNGYRLPTEAEWEFACRAGTTTDFYGGDLVHPVYDPVDPSLDPIAWYRGNIKGFIRNVGEKNPNAWGLYDMSGGVAEWCYDWYDREYYAESPMVNPRGPSTGEERIKRGGSSFDLARNCRSSYRGLSAPDGSFGNLGFRPARSWVE